MAKIIITEDARIVCEPEIEIQVEPNGHYVLIKNAYQNTTGEKNPMPIAMEKEVVTCIRIISTEKGWSRSLFRTSNGTAVLWHTFLKRM